MRYTLLTTAAAAALTLGASSVMAQTQAPGASGTAPGQLKPPATSSDSPGKSEAAPGQSQNRPSASTTSPGKSETAPGQQQRQGASSQGASSGSSADTASDQKQRPATTGATSNSQNSTQSSDSQKRPPQGDSSQSATDTKSGSSSTTQTTTDSQQRQNKGASQSATGSEQRSTTGANQKQDSSSGSATTTQQSTSGSPQQGAASQGSPTQQSGTTGTSPGTSSSSASDTSAAANLNTEQRSEVTQAFSSTNVNTVSDVNFNVSVGSTITEEVRLAPLPAEVVRIVPQYRNYQYVVVRDEIVIVEPRTKKIVEVIHKSGGSRKSASVSLNAEQRKKFKTTVETTGSTRTTSTRIELRQGEVLPEDVSLLEVPDTIITEVPELRTYRYVVVGDEIALVEPGTRRVIEVIE